jgi:hypothetical protein
MIITRHATYFKKTSYLPPVEGEYPLSLLADWQSVMLMMDANSSSSSLRANAIPGESGPIGRDLPYAFSIHNPLIYTHMQCRVN